MPLRDLAARKLPEQRVLTQLWRGRSPEKSEIFNGRVASTAEENADHREDGEDELGHQLTLLTRRNVDS